MDSNNPIKWNPFNKVVQNHRDGIINHELTNIVREKLGLPIPWNQELGFYESKFLPPVYEFLNNSERKAGLYKNLKTGRMYRAYDTAFNATNANNGQIVVLYRDVQDPDHRYVREWDEFFIKFEEVL